MKTLEEVVDAVIQGNKEKVVKEVEEALKERIDPIEILNEGLTRGLEVVGEKFEKLEIFLPEMIQSAESMKAGIKVLEPHLKQEGEDPYKKEGVVVIGTVQGDIHDIGKNIVSAFLDLSGFDVYDIGKDVPARRFIEEAEKNEADIIALSAMLTTTMGYMHEVIDELKRRRIRDKYLVIVGGGPVTQEWADQIGANGYGKDFAEAVRVCRQLLEPRRGRM